MQSQTPLTQGQGQGQGQGQPLPPQPAPQVIYIQTAPPTSKVYENYAARTSRVLGISRIVIGALSIVLQIALIVLETRDYGHFVAAFAGTGIWCGILFIIAGSFGVGAASTKTMCMIVTNMVMSIISVSICGTSYVAVSAVGVSISADNRRYSHYNKWDAILALYSITLILALAQVVSDIWSAVICCKAVCCGRPSANMVQSHGAIPQNAHVVYGQGQVFPVQQQQQQQQGQVYPVQQQQQGFSAAYNPQPQPPYQYQVQTTSGNTTPPPAYTQEEQKQPQGFAA